MKIAPTEDRENMFYDLLILSKKEWLYWLPFSFLVFVIASVCMSDWPQGFIPNIKIPYLYDGDGYVHQIIIKRCMEIKWGFTNPRIGYPFGSTLLDFPMSDTTTFLCLKFLAMIFQSHVAAYNLYFLLGFPINFIFSYLVFRVYDIKIHTALTGAMLYTYIPFHFYRLEHLFFTWYFVVPLYFYIGYKLYFNQIGKLDLLKILAISLVAFFLASFTLYYTFFGCMLIGLATLMGIIRSPSLRLACIGTGIISLLFLGFIINISSNLSYRIQMGANTEVARRLPEESEYGGFKIIQLLLPRKKYPISYFAKKAEIYNQKFPLVNENAGSYIGIVGVAGYIILTIALLAHLSGVKVDSRLIFFGIVTYFFIIFCTIGGLGTVFALFVTPVIREWNRASIFIAFATLGASLVALDFAFSYLSQKGRYRNISVICLLSIAIIGIIDQIPLQSTHFRKNTKELFNNDRDFVKTIEDQLPKGSAIYQLPYMPFPETPPIYNLTDYTEGIGFLHSSYLNWSYGGMKGREGDLFYRKLSRKNISQQIQIIQKLGFSGIWIDRRGFTDAESFEKQIFQITGKPPIVSQNRLLAFYPVSPTCPPILSEEKAREIIRELDIDSIQITSTYDSTLYQGIDFAREDWPDFLQYVSGLSFAEPFGRWSDASAVKFLLKDYLPKKFNVILNAQAFGPNVGKEFFIKIGSVQHGFRITEPFKEISIPFETNGHEQAVEIIVPEPTSPSALNQGGDFRRLGIGIAHLNFKTIAD